MGAEGPARRLRGAGGRAKKSLGQHFLASPQVALRIVQLAGVGEGSRVLEIGPGLGALTEPLLRSGALVVAVERDRVLAAALRERFPGLVLYEADAMKVDWATLLPGPGWRCVSNLPYNVGTHLVSGMVRASTTFERLVVMLQLEVAERITARPGGKAYGALSVELAARAEARLLLHVRPGSFHPPPRVDSAVIELAPRPHPAVQDLDLDGFDEVVRAAFAQRRKMLRRSLSAVYGQERAMSALTEAGIAPEERPERLPPEAFAALAKALLSLL
ncbi:MAG: 16S rRNA (adenine(1518)-N(6)/adenine(1519)-N(6))-dimethyltransferase RsmA [Pseudomonadota bacterium]